MHSEHTVMWTCTWHGIIQHKLYRLQRNEYVLWCEMVYAIFQSGWRLGEIFRTQFPSQSSTSIGYGWPAVIVGWQPFELNYRTLFNIDGIQKEFHILFCLKIFAVFVEAAALANQYCLFLLCAKKGHCELSFQ